MAHGEDLAGNLKFAVPKQARRAQAPVHLRGFKDRRMQISVIFLQRLQLRIEIALRWSLGTPPVSGGRAINYTSSCNCCI